MSVRRVEITVSEGTWGRLEVARGHEPRASFVKRALESALIRETEVARAAPVPGVSSEQSAPSRASAEEKAIVAAFAAADEVSESQGFVEGEVARVEARPKRVGKRPASGSIPVIAPRRWGQ
jgi:hypothetical protein